MCLEVTGVVGCRTGGVCAVRVVSPYESGDGDGSGGVGWLTLEVGLGSAGGGPCRETGPREWRKRSTQATVFERLALEDLDITAAELPRGEDLGHVRSHHTHTRLSSYRTGSPCEPRSEGTRIRLHQKRSPHLPAQRPLLLSEGETKPNSHSNFKSLFRPPPTLSLRDLSRVLLLLLLFYHTRPSLPLLPKPTRCNRARPAVRKPGS